MRRPSGLQRGVAAKTYEPDEMRDTLPRSRSTVQIADPRAPASARYTASHRPSGESAGSTYAPGGPTDPSSLPERSCHRSREVERRPAWYATMPPEEVEKAVANVEI